MDLRAYYRRVREVEATITDEHPVLVSLATPEGGREGVRTEVSKPNAARMIAEGRARLATAEEAQEFLETRREAERQYEQGGEACASESR